MRPRHGAWTSRYREWVWVQHARIWGINGILLHKMQGDALDDRLLHDSRSVVLVMLGSCRRGGPSSTSTGITYTMKNSGGCCTEMAYG